MSDGSYVGIDVSKARLDVAVRPGGQAWSVDNDEAGIDGLVAKLTGMAPEEFDVLYESRAGVEATLSQGICAYGLRQSRYIGEAKTNLQHVITAVAINLVRLMAWLAGIPRAQMRRSRLTRLAPSGLAV